MRAAMRFVPDHPENLAASLSKNFSLFLNGRCINPVLRVANSSLRITCGDQYSIATCHCLAQHYFFRKRVATEVSSARSIIAGEGFLNHHMLASFKCLDCQTLVS